MWTSFSQYFMRMHTKSDIIIVGGSVAIIIIILREQ